MKGAASAASRMPQMQGLVQGASAEAPIHPRGPLHDGPAQGYSSSEPDQAVDL